MLDSRGVFPYRTVMMRILSAMALWGLCSGAAFAQTQVERFGDWELFTELADGGAKVCYIATPAKTPALVEGRGEPFVMVARFPGKDEEVSISHGLMYKERSEVSISIDGRMYRLFTKDDRAWFHNAKQDAPVIQEMIRGAKLSTKAVSETGEIVEDGFSLMGFTKARQAMLNTCPPVKKKK